MAALLLLPASLRYIATPQQSRLLLLCCNIAKQEEEEGYVVVAFFIVTSCTTQRRRRRRQQRCCRRCLSLRCTTTQQNKRCSATLPSLLYCVAAQLHKSKHYLWSCTAKQFHKQTNKINERKKSKMFTWVPFWLSHGSCSGSNRSPVLSSLLQAPLLQAHSRLMSLELWRWSEGAGGVGRW